MARRHPILRAFTILAIATMGMLAVAAGVAVFAGGLGERPFFGNVVGVVELRGVIQDATDLVDALERFRTSDATVAVVLRIDSPGGAVAPSQEIYDEVGRVRERKPVIASLGSVAASGGYYVASAANKILADPGTITGSIGAIMTAPYYAPLADKIGISEETVKSGRYKDTGHPRRARRWAASSSSTEGRFPSEPEHDQARPDRRGAEALPALLAPRRRSDGERGLRQHEPGAHARRADRDPRLRQLRREAAPGARGAESQDGRAGLRARQAGAVLQGGEGAPAPRRRQGVDRRRLRRGLRAPESTAADGADLRWHPAAVLVHPDQHGRTAWRSCGRPGG